MCIIIAKKRLPAPTPQERVGAERDGQPEWSKGERGRKESGISKLTPQCILCRCFFTPYLIIHPFQQILPCNFLELIFIHILCSYLLVLVHPVDKKPFKSL